MLSQKKKIQFSSDMDWIFHDSILVFLIRWSILLKRTTDLQNFLAILCKLIEFYLD